MSLPARETKKEKKERLDNESRNRKSEPNLRVQQSHVLRWRMNFQFILLYVCVTFLSIFFFFAIQ